MVPTAGSPQDAPVERRLGLARSVRLFRSFLTEQTDPDGFYGLIADDAVDLISEHVDLAGLTIADIDRIEVNEAFACVPLMFAKEFDIGMERLNVNGGSVAIGHPLGSTGARLMTDLVYELERSGKRYGLLVICEGGGMANATVVERIG